MSQDGSDGGSVNRVRRARVERGKRSRNGNHLTTRPSVLVLFLTLSS
jgi:hypothetical protein